MKDAKKLLGEYMMLDGKVRSNDPGKAEKDLLLTDTPWGEIEEERQSVSSYDSLDMEPEDPNVSMLNLK